METQKLDSFDQAIDTLLSEHNENISLNVLQHTDEDVVGDIIDE